MYGVFMYDAETCSCYAKSSLSTDYIPITGCSTRKTATSPLEIVPFLRVRKYLASNLRPKIGYNDQVIAVIFLSHFIQAILN
jgi:hypothetical protein